MRFDLGRSIIHWSKSVEEIRAKKIIWSRSMGLLTLTLAFVVGTPIWLRDDISHACGNFLRFFSTSYNAVNVLKTLRQSLWRAPHCYRCVCTIKGMSNSEYSSLNDETSTLSNAPETRAQALNRIRDVENERLAVERIVQKRLMWLGVVVGATVGMLVGYLATLITIVDSGVGEFGFQFYRPSFVEGFLRVITAYIIGGGAVGGGIMYALFTTRQEANSVFRWIITGIAFAIGAPLLIGFLLPLTILIFADFVEGLRPGLWLSAFVETLIGSFLDGYIFLVKVLYSGFVGALLFVIICICAHVASQRVPLPATLTRAVPSSIVFYVSAALVALIPLAILMLGPFSLATSVASALTGERL